MIECTDGQTDGQTDRWIHPSIHPFTIPDRIQPPLPQDRGFINPTQNSNRYYLRNGWIYAQIGQNIQRVYPNTSPLKILDKREHGHIQGLPKFFLVPLLSQEQVKLWISNFVRIFTASVGRKAL